MIAAGIATVLVTGVEPLALASMPWEALSPQNDALRLTWHPPNRTLIRASQVTTRTPATTAVFYVPAAARPLLQAARHFSRSSPVHRPAGRLCRAASSRSTPGQSPVSPITLAVLLGLIIRNTIGVPKKPRKWIWSQAVFQSPRLATFSIVTSVCGA